MLMLRKFHKLSHVILVILIIVLTGCGKGQGDGRVDTKLQTGTKGVTINILEQGLPTQVVETDSFYMSLAIQNEGFSDIEEGMLFLNLNKDLIEFKEWDTSQGLNSKFGDVVGFNLGGKSLVNTMGEKKIVRALLNAKGIDSSLNKLESQIGIIACYPYKTIMSRTICIDTDPLGLSIAQKTCEAKALEENSGQGAPITIAKIEQNIVPSTNNNAVGLQFTIFAENKGKGELINVQRYEDVCLGESVQKDDFNVLLLEKFQFSDYEYVFGQNYEITCEPNPMRQTKEGFFTRCTLNDEYSIEKSKLTFETQMVVELSYGYQEKISKKITIANKDAQI